LDERWRKRGRRLLDYLAAAAIASAALLLRKLLPIEPGVGLYPLPLTAIIVSAWLGGRGPGLLATALSMVGIAHWFLPSLESFVLDQDSAIGFAIFVAAAVVATEFSMARRRAERALRESEAYLAETQRLSHTGSWAWAPATGELRYLSEECRRILDLAREGERAHFEQTFFQRIHPEDLAEAALRVRTAIERRADFELEYRSLRPDGDTRDLYAIGHPVLGPAGEVTEFVGTLVDVTERMRAEQERERLRQAQADLERLNRVTTMGELAASLAHEIRQPIAAALTNARTCLRWLERAPPDLAEARAAAARSAADTTRAAEIITRVRSLFQKAAPRRDLTDVNAVVGEMVSVLRGEAQRHAVAIRADLAGGLPQVVADRVQLQQVLMNLMVNAIDAMKGAGDPRALTIRTRPAEGGCQVTVSDTGPGLPRDQAERIFDAFFTTKPDGTGMGLPISRSIVESHGGRLWAEPAAGAGAAFHFTLPSEGEGSP
jgi:signal transduction histidine kinase